MSNTDETYKFFTVCYTSKGFVLGGKMLYDILSPMFPAEAPLNAIWKYKLSELLNFLSVSGFTFDSEDSFYDMLATIALQIKKNPDIHWKALLS